MDIAVTRLDPADQEAALRAYEIDLAAGAVDVPDLPPPSRRAFLARVADPGPGYRHEYAIARVDGVPAGFMRLDLPFLDNLHNADLEIYVHPTYRRRGVGRALHAYAVGLAARDGRKHLAGMSPTALPGGPARDGAFAAFAQSVGAYVALTDVRRRLDIAAVDDAALDGALAGAWQHAPGYSLVQWSGATPEEIVADVAYLDGRLLADAPMGDLTWEPEKVDAQRIREMEATNTRRGRQLYHTGVRHDASGRLVGWTTLSRYEDPDWHAWQLITIVDPDHRGHRIGTIVKIENLRYTLMAEPTLRYIDTFNAAENDHMISINELMGFRPVDAWHNWQQDL